MTYKFKKGLKLKNKKREYIYALSKDEMPIFIGGMAFKVEDLNSVDEFIEIASSSDDFKYLALYNISQNDFDKIIEGLKKKIIEIEYTEIEKNNKILDLKKLKLCKKLKSVKISYSEKTLKLWNMRFNHKLVDVTIEGVKKLLNQKGLIGAKVKNLSIKRYSYGMPDAKELLIKDFNIFKTMPNLEYLNLFVKKKKNKVDDLLALSKLKNIKEIHLTKNYFFYNQYAWLKGKLPNTEGIGCVYKVEYDHANEMDGYIINGSRKCWYIRGFEKNKLNRYLKDFDNKVKLYEKEDLPPIK